MRPITECTRSFPLSVGKRKTRLKAPAGRGVEGGGEEGGYECRGATGE